MVQTVSFGKNMENGGIFCKIDYLTMIFNNCSFNDIFKLFDIQDYLTDDLMTYFFDLTCNGGQCGNAYTLNVVPGVMVQVQFVEMYKKFGVLDLDQIRNINSSVFFDKKFDYIRWNVSGSGLDFFRDNGFDVDGFIFTDITDSLPDDAAYHYTRIDFCYDLVNYKPEFMQVLRAGCDVYQNRDTCKIPVSGTSQGISYEMHDGATRTIYLGRGGSDRLLRIYDKRWQFYRSNQLDKCPYNTVNEYGETVYPSSWIRIEWQLRREKYIHPLINSENFSFLGVFKSIYNFYALREGFGNNRPICKFWQELFDWETIPTIIQNAKYELYDKDYASASVSACVGYSFNTIVTFIGNYGLEAFFNLIADEFKNLQFCENGSPGKRRSERVINRLLMSYRGSLPPFVKRDQNGHYYLLNNLNIDPAIKYYLNIK